MKETLQHLNAQDEGERCFAAQDLGYENQPGSVVPLIERLKIESSRIVKEAIVVAIGKLNEPGVIEAAIGLLESEDSYIRNAAVSILKKRGVEAIPTLLERLEHPDPDIRKFSLDVLTVIEANLADTIYGKALEDSDVNIRITAVEYVGKHRKFEFKKAVENILVACKSTMLASACMQTLLMVGDETSYDLVLSKYPKEEWVPVALKDLWWRYIWLHFKDRFANGSSGKTHSKNRFANGNSNEAHAK